MKPWERNYEVEKTTNDGQVDSFLESGPVDPIVTAAERLSPMVKNLFDSTVDTFIPDTPTGTMSALEAVTPNINAGTRGVSKDLESLGKTVGRAVRGSTENIREAVGPLKYLPGVAGPLGAADLFSDQLTPSEMQRSIGAEGIPLAGQAAGLLGSTASKVTKIPGRVVPETMQPSWFAQKLADFGQWVGTAKNGSKFVIPEHEIAIESIIQTPKPPAPGLPPMNEVQLLKVHGPNEILNDFGLRSGETYASSDRILNLIRGLNKTPHPRGSDLQKWLSTSTKKSSYDLPSGIQVYNDGNGFFTLLPQNRITEAMRDKALDAIRGAGMAPGRFYSFDEIMNLGDRLLHGVSPVMATRKPSYTIPGQTLTEKIHTPGTLGVDAPKPGFATVTTKGLSPSTQKILEEAKAKGPEQFAVTDYVLQQRDPEYQAYKKRQRERE